MAWPVVAVVLGVLSTLVDTLGRLPRPDNVVPNPFAWTFGDVVLFARLGDAVLLGDVGAGYRDPENQAGPAQILADALLARLSTLLGPDSGPGTFVVQAMVSCSVLLAFGVTAAVLARHVGPVGVGVLGRWLPWMPVASVVLAFAFATPVTVATNGHWWQIPVLLAWWAAGVLALRNRPVLAGLLVAATVALEPWGVFGAVSLLLASTWRARIVGVLVAGAAAAMVWLPFFAQPDFALREFTWKVKDGSLWSAWMRVGDPFPWSLRAVQAVVVLLVAVLVVRWVMGRLEPVWAAWLVPVVIVLTRIASDVWYAQYYWAAVQSLLLPAGLVLLAVAWRQGLIVVFAGWLTFAGWAVMPPFVAAWLALLAVLACFAFPVLRPGAVERSAT